MRLRNAALLMGLSLMGLSVSTASAAAQEPNRIVDIYSVADTSGHSIHIVADGDISNYLSDRVIHEDRYVLVLDVPALPPIESRYEVDTPFSRRFQVWPIELSKDVYTRIEVEITNEASSVIGSTHDNHLFIRLQRKTNGAAAAPMSVVETGEPESSEARDILPIDPPFTEDSDGEAERSAEPPPRETDSPSEPDARSEDGETTEKPDATEGDELFLNLFPTPRENLGLFKVATEDPHPEEPIEGIRVGRFALKPLVNASYLSGSNLLLQSGDTASTGAVFVRGGVVATLLDSAHQLRLGYEGRYRDIENFELSERFTNLFDVGSTIETSTRTALTLSNRYVRGAFESREFDPGGEVPASGDAFFRNYSKGVFKVALTDRVAGELSASFNRVRFDEAGTDFFDYDNAQLGATVLYRLSPVLEVLGEYARLNTNAQQSRPVARSTGAVVSTGLRGAITPLLTGTIRVGYSEQAFGYPTTLQNFRGLVADVQLVRQFAEASALEASFGRRTNPSAFEEHGFYISSYVRARFITPLSQRLKLTVSSLFFTNRYPLTQDSLDDTRHDQVFGAVVGAAYFWTPLTYLSVDYRHDRRRSNLTVFGYKNHAIEIAMGVGFLSR